MNHVGKAGLQNLMIFGDGFFDCFTVQQISKFAIRTV